MANIAGRDGTGGGNAVAKAVVYEESLEAEEDEVGGRSDTVKYLRFCEFCLCDIDVLQARRDYINNLGFAIIHQQPGHRVDFGLQVKVEQSGNIREPGPETNGQL